LLFIENEGEFIKGTGRFEVSVKAGFLRSGVFDAQNIVTIPRAKLLRKPGNLIPSPMAAAETAARMWLGL
jgi:mRNA interferase MazF